MNGKDKLFMKNCGLFSFDELASHERFFPSLLLYNIFLDMLTMHSINLYGKYAKVVLRTLKNWITLGLTLGSELFLRNSSLFIVVRRKYEWLKEKRYSTLLTYYSLTSVCIFSILLSRHFLGFWQGEFVQQSRASLVGDHLLYSHGLNVWLRGGVLRRN